MDSRDDGDEDAWLRAGSSFAGEAQSKPRPGPESTALVVRDRKRSKKKEKRAKRSKERRYDDRTSSDSESDRERRRRPRKHTKQRKKHKRESSRGSRRYRSSSDSSSYSENTDDGRRSRKRSRRQLDGDHDDSTDGHELALLEEPPEGAIEVYEGRSAETNEKLFEFDRAGDKENAFFGTLYKHEQPLYRLATRRSIVDGQWIVHKPQGGDSGRARPSKGAADEDSCADRYFGIAAKKMERRVGAKRLHMAYSQRRLARQNRVHAVQEELPFIPLDAVVDGELQGLEVSDDSADDERQDRSAALLWQTDQENIEAFIVTRNKKLNEHLHKHPEDVETWLDLIAFQSQAQRLTSKTSRLASTDVLVLEKQQAVLAKALERNPSSRVLQRLQLNFRSRDQQIRAKNASVDSSDVVQLLENLLESDRTNGELWARRLQTAQSKFSTFSMTMLRDLYARTLSVLNKELVKSVEEPSAVKASSSFIHVMSTDSLLGKPDPYEQDTLGDKATAIATSLLAFHHRMVHAEKAAGYSERAIAQVQALLKFNQSKGVQQAATISHQRALEVFMAEWNSGAASFAGEEDESKSKCALSSPPVERFQQLREKAVNDMVYGVNAPVTIFDKVHESSLVGMLAVDGDGNNGGDATTSSAVEASRAEQPRGEWVYSNLHGTRIWVPAAEDESREYERILSTLRGTESSLERQQARERKLKTKQERVEVIRAKLRDERVDYANIPVTEDQHLPWLAEEVEAELTQWLPLESSNPDHAELIEEQPDRTILTDEIVPFIFRLPRVLHLQIVQSLLSVLGVHWTRDAHSEQGIKTLTSDSFEGSLATLVQPIVNALDPSTSARIAMTSHQRLCLLLNALRQHVRVDAVAAVDAQRVQFIRRVFANALKSSMPATSHRILKTEWIEFEAQVVAAEPAALDSFRSFVQQLLHSQEDELDTVLLDVYATVELRLGQNRQATRICDKTVAAVLASIPSTSSSDSVSRVFHRLLFTRVQLILDDTHGEEDVLLALYFLYQVWHPGAVEPLDRFLKQYKRGQQPELAAKLKTILLPVASAIVETYRVELDVSMRQCGQSKHSCDRHSHSLDCHVPYALHNLCFCLNALHGLDAAREEFELVLTDTAPCHAYSSRIMFLAFLQRHQTVGRHPVLAPREWRRCVAASVDKFRFDPLLLRLFVDAETSNTTSQILRKYFDSRRKEWERFAESPALVEWVFMLLCEFARAERAAGIDTQDTPSKGCCLLHRWGCNRPAVDRIRRVFEDMVTEGKTSGQALAWRLYLRFELAVGRVESARKVLYRGLASCPWSKALYLDGVRVLRPYLTVAECHELIEFMHAKEIHMRVDD